MSLKEEIRRNVIHKLLDDPNCSYDDITNYIDDILKLFEKQLTSLWDKNRVIIFSKTDKSDDFKTGYDEAIMDIVKDILISENNE